MTDHLDDEVLGALADTDAGTGTGRAPSESERRHLDRCPECSARLRDIHAVRRALASLPRVAMPADVLAGIEQRLRSEPGAPPVVRPDSPAVPAGARRRGRALGWLSAAAALALVAGAISVAVSANGGRHGSQSAANRAPTGLVATPGGSAQGLAPNAGGSGGSAHILALSASAIRVATGLDYHHATLQPGASTLLGAGPATGPHSGVVGAVGPSSGCLAALGPALTGVGGAALEVQAVDAARYDDVPALILVLAERGSSGRRIVAAVAAGCSAQDAQLLDQVSARP